MADRNAGNPTPIPPERCTSGGLTGVDAMDWALRAALALLAISALWLVIVAIKPLPAGQAQSPPPIPTLAEAHTSVATIEERQRRLASLNHGGNIFAPDRENWPVELVRAADIADADAPIGRNATQSPSAIAASQQSINEIELARNAPTAVRKRLDQLKLRGVYVAGGEPAAMIGKKTNAGSESYRVGDTFDDGEWSLVAIDDVQDRVILNRSGLNFELRLYDTGRVAGASPRTAINATNGTGDVEIDFTSLDKVASQLREAGLPRDEINELITLAQSGPDETDADKPDKPGDADGEKTKPVAIPPAMPPGMIQLFKAMAEGSREVVAPPAPKPESTDEAEADAADEETADADKSDSSESESK